MRVRHSATEYILHFGIHRNSSKFIQNFEIFVFSLSFHEINKSHYFFLELSMLSYSASSCLHASSATSAAAIRLESTAITT